MRYDVAIIGAGMSGLAAGIRLAYFEKSVCILERHYAYGGLNSYYKLDGREFDVGLHAVTNYVDGGDRNAPLPKLLRQLRISREEFDLHPQRYSEVRFPGRSLKFANGFELIADEVAREFPHCADRFLAFVESVRRYDDVALDAKYEPARPRLLEALGDPVLVEMLLCPVMYYGSAEEHDMDFTQFVTMFKALFLEGFARPPGGVRVIIKALVRKFRELGGKIRMNCGVKRVHADARRVEALELDDGETITADLVLSSAGYLETMAMCDPALPDQALPAGVPNSPGRMSFVETIAIMNRRPDAIGHDATIVFENRSECFAYTQPDGLVDLQSAVVCCPTNYLGHEKQEEGVFRVTWIASHPLWTGLDESGYRAAKAEYLDEFLRWGEAYMPGFRESVVFADMFTPRTIERYTGHHAGAVYGAPQKVRDGRTHLENLYICGTDQGFLGIIGAMLSGITIANLYGLSSS